MFAGGFRPVIASVFLPFGDSEPWYLITGITPYAAYRAIGATSLAASKVNLITPGTHDLINGTTPPTFDAATGWILGANRYLLSDIQPAGTWTTIIRFSGAVTSAENFLFGVFDGGGNEYGIANRSGVNTVRYENPNTVLVAPLATAGTLAIAGANGYRDGIKEATTLTVSPGTASKVMYVGALNLNGSLYAALAKNIQAFIVFDSTLTDAQVLTQANAMAALANP